MKKNIRLLLSGILVILIPLCIQCSSKKTDPTPVPCVLQTSNQSVVVNTNSITNGNKSTFTFSQVVTSYTDVSCGQAIYGSTSLTITNPTVNMVSISYAIAVTIGAVNWQYQSTAAIPANSTVNVGIINNSNTQSITAGTIAVQVH